MGDSKFLCSEYDGKADQAANEMDSREWDHSCNTGNVTVDGKYLEECCNLTDHIRLPIIHKIYRNIHRCKR